MKLYFTADAKIDPEHSVLFNRVAVDIRETFVDVIESLSRQNKDSIDWWVSSPVSRDVFARPFFHYCCYLVVLQEFIRAKEHFAEIITDSRAFKKILEGYLARKGVKTVVTLARRSLKQSLKELVRPLYVMLGLPLRHLLLFFIAKKMRPLRSPLPLEPLTLINTFVMPGYIERDRYYPGLLGELSEKEKKCVWFVPQLYGFRSRQLPQVVKRLRKAERNFLSKDDFLKFRDYWCLWRHFLEVRKLRLKPRPCHGVDISCLVREQMTSFRGIGPSYTSLLNFRFVKRLKEADVKLKLVIDWFENQNFSRGWNTGFRRFFADTETKGYQGFIASPHYLYAYPTDMENDCGVIPKKVAVIGKGWAQSVRKFCSDLDVCVAPAFRYQHVWRKKQYSPAENGPIVLVSLSTMVDEAMHILKLLASAANRMADSTRFWIKPHPAASQSQIQRAFGDGWPARFIFVSGDFSDCVEKSDLLISTYPSACMETLAKGIPVIIIGNSFGLDQNPIPETITEDIWQLCYTPGEIAKAVHFFKNRSPEKIKEHEEIGKKIREEFFEPVTGEGVRKLLGLIQPETLRAS